MENSIDIGKIICNDIDELLQKNESNSVKNEDFTKTWCDMAILVASQIEFIVRTSLHTQNGYNKNEAVIYGQLMRIVRMLCYQRRLVCKQVMTTILAGFFERMLLEGNINLQYFILNYNDSELNDFRLHSLKAEAIFEEVINNDIAQNGGQPSLWQSNLLNSIHDTYNKAQTTYEEVKKSKAKLPNICQKFNNTGNQKLYDVAYRTKCHDIHGDWVDFTQNYLTYDNTTNTFSPNLQEYDADLRQLNPILIICCDTLIKFIKHFPGHGLSEDICDEINQSMQLAFLLENMHDNFINKKDLLENVNSPLTE